MIENQIIFDESQIKFSNREVTYKWIFILENYEIIYSENIYKTRVRFVKIGRKLNFILDEFIHILHSLKVKDFHVQKQILNDILNKSSFCDLFLDYSVLISDFKNYLNDETYGQVFNRKTKKREVKDKTLPYLFIKDNELVIINGKDFYCKILSNLKYLKELSTRM